MRKTLKTWGKKIISITVLLFFGASLFIGIGTILFRLSNWWFFYRVSPEDGEIYDLRDGWCVLISIAGVFLIYMGYKHFRQAWADSE